MRKRFYTTLTGKVILATVAGIITIYIIHQAISQSFEEITEKVDRLSRPNERLMAVNMLFREISQLNHTRHQERRSPSMAYIDESNSIYSAIEALRHLFGDDSVQTQRLDEIELKLNHREKLFQEYLELQQGSSANPDFSELLEILSGELNGDSLKQGSQVFKVLETTTYTTVSSDTLFNQPKGFFTRVFGRRQIFENQGIIRSVTHVDKEVKVAVDTIAVQRNDSLVATLENSIDSLQARQLQTLAQIQRQELELMKTNNSLTHEIISIINALEQEEITRLDSETRSAFEIAHKTISNLNFVAAIFISISVLLVLLIFVDISKSNRYRKKLEQAHSAAKSEAESKQRFLSNMSHEIRTPLQSIYGYTELARLQPGRKADIETIYQSAKHLLQVVNEVLDYSKITSGHFNLENILFDPEEEIKSVLTAIDPMVRQKGLKLSFENELHNTPLLSGDPFRLKQILFNLTGNAIKFTSEGEIIVFAGKRHNSKHVQLVIRITDTGIGIPEEQLPYLFEEYSRAGHSFEEMKNGTGLGLSIVKKLTELQGGSIEVESTPGKGSSFTVTIPYQEGDPYPEERFKKKITGSAQYNGKTEVMLADDDPHIINLSTAIFKNIKIRHRTFQNGEDLLQALPDSNDSIVFLDIRMPGISGLEVCKKIRQQAPAGKQIKIFALTAQALPDERESILAKGFDGIIIKPFKESDILDAIGISYLRSPEECSPLNLDSLFRMTGGDTGQVKEFLAIVLKESRNDLRLIRKAARDKNYDILILTVHRLAGRVAQAGAGEYATALRKLERELQNGTDRKDLDSSINEILSLGDTFIENVRGFMNTLISG